MVKPSRARPMRGFLLLSGRPMDPVTVLQLSIFQTCAIEQSSGLATWVASLLDASAWPAETTIARSMVRRAVFRTIYYLRQKCPCIRIPVQWIPTRILILAQPMPAVWITLIPAQLELIPVIIIMIIQSLQQWLASSPATVGMVGAALQQPRHQASVLRL